MRALDDDASDDESVDGDRPVDDDDAHKRGPLSGLMSGSTRRWGAGRTPDRAPSSRVGLEEGLDNGPAVFDPEAPFST